MFFFDPMKKNIVFIFISYLIISCEGNTDEIFNVTNNSSSEITIVFNKSTLGTDSIQVIPVGIEKEVAFLSFRGGISNAGGPILFDTVTVYNATDTMKTNFVYEQNWNSTTKQESKIPSAYTHTHHLEITDADF